MLPVRLWPPSKLILPLAALGLLAVLVFAVRSTDPAPISEDQPRIVDTVVDSGPYDIGNDPGPYDIDLGNDDANTIAWETMKLAAELGVSGIGVAANPDGSISVTAPSKELVEAVEKRAAELGIDKATVLGPGEYSNPKRYGPTPKTTDRSDVMAKVEQLFVSGDLLGVELSIEAGTGEIVVYYDDLTPDQQQRTEEALGKVTYMGETPRPQGD